MCHYYYHLTCQNTLSSIHQLIIICINLIISYSNENIKRSVKNHRKSSNRQDTCFFLILLPSFFSFADVTNWKCAEMESSYVRTDFESEVMNVRFIQQLKIRIGEAKNLAPKNGANVLKDCFCVIRLDREEIFRTHCSTEKTLHPFFGEDFYFDIPRIFRFLSIYLYEREKTVNTIRNRPLGKVTIKRSQLCRFSSDEAWFPLLPVNCESEIEGKINLLIEPKYNFNSNSLGIIVNVFECQNLSVECCDSHVAIELKLNDNKILNRKSKVKKKTSNPQFNESFYFEISLSKYCYDNTEFQYICHRLLASSELVISVVHNSCGRSNNGFLGEVKIPLNKLELNVAHRAWYFLQPKSQDQKTKSYPNLGSLRLKINYISDYVFSSHFYDSLSNQLLASTKIKPVTSSAAYLLGEFILNKADAAQPLVKIFLHFDELVPLIRYLAEDEISKITDVNTIFRGNSLVSKCIDELMKLVGIRYLHETLKGFVEKVIIEQKSCEIDPNRLKEGDSLVANTENLKQYILDVFYSIINTVSRCPVVMCEVFSVLKELAIKFFPGNKEVCYYVISGFVFLRFFAPAILNPRLFELTDRSINGKTNRTFTLISKTIQSIGNLAISKKTSQFNKESYMIPIYKDFITEKYIIKTKEFLELISSSCRILIKDNHEPVILKESIMYKKSRYKRIGFGTTYKKRYFCITTQHFFYAKEKNKTPLFKLPIDEISINKLPDGYHSKNMFQIVHPKCTLHIQASNCVQEKEWLDTLSRLIELSQNKSDQNGDSARRSSDNDSRRSGLITPDLCIKLDVDRELERVHCLFVQNQTNMQSIKEACETGHNSVKIFKGHGKGHASQFMIEDERTLMQTLNKLRECVSQLERNHQRHLENIHGTESAPIEVDSYCNGNFI